MTSRRAFILLISLLLPTSLPAQSPDSARGVGVEDSERIRFAVRAGWNVALGLTASDGLDPDHVSGIVAGVGMHVPLNRWLSIEPELLISQKGGAVVQRTFDIRFRWSDTSFAIFDRTTRIRSTYIELPVSARVTVRLRRGSRIFVFGGFHVARLLASAMELELSSRGSDERTTSAAPLELASFDVGWQAGVGSATSFSDVAVECDVRYTAAFSEAQRSGVPIRNEVLSLALRFGF